VTYRVRFEGRARVQLRGLPGEGFDIVQSYLSTVAKWGISTLHALRGLFTGHAWLPPGIEPSG
jgi:hypothetical protein